MRPPGDAGRRSVCKLHAARTGTLKVEAVGGRAGVLDGALPPAITPVTIMESCMHRAAR